MSVFVVTVFNRPVSVCFVVSFLWQRLSFAFNLEHFIIPGRKCGSVYLGKATAATRAALPSAVRVCIQITR